MECKIPRKIEENEGSGASVSYYGIIRIICNGEFLVIYCNACVCELNSLYINVVSRVGYLYLEESIIQKQ